MKLVSALATLALVTSFPVVPAYAEKDDKLPKCDGRHRRPANLYGTILPTLPPRPGTAPAAALSPPASPPPAAPGLPTTDLFPPEQDTTVTPAPVPETSSVERVPAIGEMLPAASKTTALLPSFASC